MSDFAPATTPKVTKAVIAAAGYGTRFLPQTKAMPKEMLPLVDKPIIQFIVEELVEAGIKDIILITGYSKRSIEDHFDTPNEDLLNNLRAGGPSKAHYIEEIERISDLANFAYVRQKGPYGTATPVLNAAHLVGNEPFIYCFADDLTVATPNAFGQMIALYEEFQASILPCIRIEDDKEFTRYGILGGQQVRDGVLKLDSIKEKPGRAAAPSNLASVGGYLLTPEVFKYVERALQTLTPGKEFFMTDDILQPMLADGKALYGCEIKNSTRYDTGDKLEYLKTVISFALKRDDIGPEFREFLRSIVA
ncbi:MAG TPA: UTP--glucose-1-phosphate uridylyltransferase [Candidatus Saccharimonadales bacterium]|nr:UTP--glucose-1-phosphate uridylyltransferase [Candidatus Saccharimonadales bacterium]